MFVVPAVRIEPISPSVILAVPEAPTVRLVRLAALNNVPPVTLAVAPEPDVMLVVPAEVVTDPAETVTLPRLMAVIRAPAEETLPVRLPPVRLAVPPPTVRSFRIALAVNVLPVTLARPVTFAVPPVMFVVPAVRIEPISPAVILAVPEAPTVRLPRLIFESKVPAVILALPLNVPPERFEVLALTIRPLSVPPVRFKSTEVVVRPVMLPPEIVTLPPTAVSVVALPELIERLPLDVRLPIRLPA